MISPLIFFGQSFKNRNVIGEDSAKRAIKNAMADDSGRSYSDTLIKNSESAISIAETILASVYGKAVINSEKPFECYLIDGYWYLRGTLPKNYTGAVFEMIMSAKDGRVVKLTHGK
jgi:hypothetical protein